MEYDNILSDILGRKDFLVVGKNVIRTDALDKALGKAKYTADYVPKGTTILKVYRSTVAHAKIRSIDTSEALKVPGVEAIYTGADITGNNQIGYALPDQPFLNDKKVHFVGDPIALICAKDEYAATEAMDKMYVDYEELPAYLDIDAALEEGVVDIHEGGNVAVVTKIRKGDLAGVFESADAVVEDIYWSPYQDHTYIETEAAYAIP
ncbi:MAG: molybdopterin cofactor-binding domain-containing protein, partial [Candidatus Aminicenantaceae bacterium]